MAKAPAKTESAKQPAATGVAERYAYPLDRFRAEMDDLFDGFFGRDPWRWEPFGERGEAGRLMAPVDFKETDGAYTLQAELPGMSEKDIELELHDGVLTLKGEKKSERSEKKDDYHLSERSFGSFRRSIRVPDSVQEDKIAADFKNGVLTVSLPKSKEARKKARKISIKG